MTLKRKIIFSNILMLLVPILLSLLIGTIILQTVGNRYWFSLEKMYQDDNGVYSAQSLLYAYSDELSEYNWVHYENFSNDEKENTEEHEEGKEGDSDYLKQTAIMKDLEDELASMGYHFVIISGNETQFRNLLADEQNIIVKYLGGDYLNMDSFIIKDEESSIIKNTFFSNGRSYEMIAIGLGDNVPSNSQSYLQRYITTFAVIFLASIFFFFVLINYLISRSLGKAIMRPLKKLKEGTSEVKEGNLDFEIDYNKKDEFGDVCKAFDEMRLHLKESVDSRLKYDQYRKQIIAGISHDLRTPLTSIKGYTEGLKDGVADTKDKKNRYYNAILTRTQDMQRLVDNLAEYTKLEQQSFKYDQKKTDMCGYIKSFLAKYEHTSPIANLSTSVICYATDSTVLIDTHEMQRVFENLLENAVKHSDKNSVTVRFYLKNENGSLSIEVQDNGQGVKDNELDDIFTSFYRGEKSRTNAGDGSGLGLSIVKQIVEGHRGSVYARNDNGLCIIIRLPVCREDI